METDVAVKLTDHENRIKVSEHRIADLEDQQKIIQELTMSVHDLALSVKQLCEDQTKYAKRLEDLEKQPAENWRTLVKTALTAIVSAIVTAAIAGLF